MSKKGVRWGVVIGTGAAIAGGVALFKWLLGESEEAARARRHITARVNLACRILGISALPVMADDGVPNVAYRRGTIVYNRTWVIATLGRHCTDGSCQDQVILGIVAHEVGHHLYAQRVASGGHPHAAELWADDVAGRVLAAAGRGVTDFETVIRSESPVATPTHPDGWLRVVAIRRGYEAIAGRCLGYAT